MNIWEVRTKEPLKVPGESSSNSYFRAEKDISIDFEAGFFNIRKKGQARYLMIPASAILSAVVDEPELAKAEKKSAK